MITPTTYTMDINKYIAIVTTIGVIVGIGGIIVSIGIYRLQNKAKLKVNALVVSIPNHDNILIADGYAIHVTATNISEVNVNINQTPSLFFPIEIHDTQYFAIPLTIIMGKYMGELKHGDVLDILIRLDKEFYERINYKALINKKIKLLFWDTLGRKYFSNELDINQLIELCTRGK